MSTPSSKLNICGPNVKRIRKSQNPPITQEQLATKLQTLGWDIDRFVISKIERGNRRVTDKELLIFTQVLSTSLDELLKPPIKINRN